MDNHKQNMRQQAAKAFMASLDDFQNMLAQTEETLPPVSPATKHPSKKKDTDIFEEALADIDAFMEKRSHPES